MAQGAPLHVHGLGRIAEDPKTRSYEDVKYAEVMLAEWPKPEGKVKKRGLARVTLRVKNGQSMPKKGQVVLINSGTYEYREYKKEGEVKYFHSFTAFSWSVLPVGSAPASSPSVETGDTEEAAKPATPDNPSEASPPPMGIEEEDEEVPF